MNFTEVTLEILVGILKSNRKLHRKFKEKKEEIEIK